MPGITLDVFRGDAFGLTSSTIALEKIPYQPKWLGSLGLFNNTSIRTTTATIEERHGILSLVPTSARGTATITENRRTRKKVAFPVPHLALTAGLLADDVQNVVAFGTDNVLETVSQKFNDTTTQLRDDLEVTKEYHRYGAIQGITLEDDMTTTLFNYFDAFGVTEQVVNFDLADDAFSVKTACAEVIRKMHKALGQAMFTGIIGLAGDEFFDALVSQAVVRSDYDRWMDGRFYRTQQMGGTGYFVGPDGTAGFDYGGITWFNSRASIGDDPFIPTDVARFFPLGVPNLFIEINAPAEYSETVNTLGRPYYVKQERKPFDIGIDVVVSSNPLILCTRPRVLIKGTNTAES